MKNKNILLESCEEDGGEKSKDIISEEQYERTISVLGGILNDMQGLIDEMRKLL